MSAPSGLDSAGRMHGRIKDEMHLQVGSDFDEGIQAMVDEISGTGKRPCRRKGMLESECEGEVEDGWGCLNKTRQRDAGRG